MTICSNYGDTRIVDFALQNRYDIVDCENFVYRLAREMINEHVFIYFLTKKSK